MVTFAPGETRECVNVSIVDDNVVEDLEESFWLEIDSVDPVVVGLGPNPNSTVIIIDDDSKF